jgi:hypothetical protein
VGLGRALLCVVVLWGEIATDIPRARLIKKQLLTIAKLPIYAARLATNPVVGDRLRPLIDHASSEMLVRVVGWLWEPCVVCDFHCMLFI